MPDVLDHMTGALYRIGLHHEDGAASLVSLTAHPIRFAVGEMSATAADLIVNARGSRPHPTEGDGKPGGSPSDFDIGPSTI